MEYATKTISDLEPIGAEIAQQICNCLGDLATQRFVMLYLMSGESIAVSDGVSVAAMSNSGKALYQCIKPFLSNADGAGRQRVVVLDRQKQCGWKTTFMTAMSFIDDLNT